MLLLSQNLRILVDVRERQPYALQEEFSLCFAGDQVQGHLCILYVVDLEISISDYCVIVTKKSRNEGLNLV